MNYDKVHELVKQIQDTAEFQNYKRTKELVLENDLNVAMLKEMKSLQRVAQSQIIAGKAVDDVTQQKLRKLSETLQFNEHAADFLMAEYNFNKIISDIFKMIADGVGINLNLFDD